MLDAIKQRLHGQKGRWRAIARDADVGYEWLVKFSQGHIKDPGYQKIARLYQVLQMMEKRPGKTPPKDVANG